jgi:ATP/ADP translocase
MQQRMETKVPEHREASEPRSWRRFRRDYAVIGGSWIIISICVAVIRMNAYTCASVRDALAQTPYELFLIFFTFGYIVFPVIIISIAIGGLLGYAMNLRSPLVFALVAALAGFYGFILANSSAHWLCGGGPYL